MIKLTLTEKGGEPKVLTFDKDEITIGRVSGNDIVLAKGNISKRHTRLTKREGGMEIADLKSTNGTYVNGRKIAGPTAVAPSDRIYVGDFLIGLDGPGAACRRRRAACTARRARPARPADFPFRRRPRRPRAAGRARRGFPTRRPRRAAKKRKTSSSPHARRARAGQSRRHRRRRRSARRPTPMASASLGLDDEEEPFADGPPIEMSQPSEDTGNVGLFQHTRRGTDDDVDGASRRVGDGKPPGTGRRRGSAGARVRRRDRSGRDPRARCQRRRRGAWPGDVARRSGGHADPDHRARTRRWSIGGRVCRCTTATWAIRTRSRTCCGATRTTPIRRRRRTTRSSTCACRTAPASRRRSRRPRREAWWRRSAGPCCPSGSWSISCPARTRMCRRCSTRWSRRAGTCW